MYFDLDPCCLLEVAIWVIVRYSLRYSKVANIGFATPNRGRVYLWPLVGIITQESLAIVEMSCRVSSGA